MVIVNPRPNHVKFSPIILSKQIDILQCIIDNHYQQLSADFMKVFNHNVKCHREQKKNT